MLEAAGLSPGDIADWRASARPPEALSRGGAGLVGVPEARGGAARTAAPAGAKRRRREGGGRGEGGARRRAHPIPARPRRGRLRRTDRRPAACDPRRGSRLPRGRAVPGARPDARPGRGRARAGASRQGGRRDRAGALLRVRARVGALRLAPRLGDAPADEEALDRLDDFRATGVADLGGRTSSGATGSPTSRSGTTPT